jgi:hypothetical protein
MNENAQSQPAEKKPKTYSVQIDKTKYDVDTPTPTCEQLLGLAGKTSATHKLYQHAKGNKPVQVDPGATVNLEDPGLERFSTMPKDTTEGAR